MSEQKASPAPDALPEPKKYVCEYCGRGDDLLIDASFHYCDVEDLQVEIKRLRAEVDRLRVEVAGWMEREAQAYRLLERSEAALARAYAVIRDANTMGDVKSWRLRNSQVIHAAIDAAMERP